MKTMFYTVLLSFFISCSLSGCAQSKKKFEGTFSNGMKGAKISFVLSADGKKIEDVTFSGYWRCDGKLENTTVGPDGGFPVTKGKIDGVIVEPEDGGATAFRFEMHGTINGNKASGTFRMNINALSCDTYLLNWTAVAK